MPEAELAHAGSRPDANKIALRAIRSILGASPPADLVVEGQRISITPTVLPPQPWPTAGLRGLDRAEDGPLPGTLRLECAWGKGRTVLNVSAGWWRTASSYSDLLGIGVEVASTGQKLVWVTVALPIRETPEGNEAKIVVQFSLFTRQGEQSARVLGRLGHRIQAAVQRSGLPLASDWRVDAFSVRVPDGDVKPSPAEALHRLVHVALLKLPFFMRGRRDGIDGEPPFAIGDLPDAGGTDAPSGAAVEGRRQGVAPLPGGVRGYKATLDAIVSVIGERPRSRDELYQLLRDEYEVSGETARDQYLTQISNLGFVEEKGGELRATDAGLRYLATDKDPRAVFDRLHEEFAGVLEVLVIADHLGRADTTRTHRLLTGLLGVEWGSNNQTAFRRNWLLSIGATTRTNEGDAPTQFGKELLDRFRGEAEGIRRRLEGLLEESGPDEEPAIAEPVPGLAGESKGPAGAPPAWNADRLDLTAAMVLPHIAKQKLSVPGVLVERAAAAVSAGKHLLLVGPPGTGKTELAHAIVDAAAAEGYCDGAFVATASADWTTFDTIGGYALEKTGALRFRPGAFLRAVESFRWLVIDEINRADVDRAFGELMTVLAGRSTDAPYTLEDGRGVSIGRELRCSHQVPVPFRVIATMNTWDKTSLFRLSYAVQRRFAILNVGVPDDSAYAAIIEEAAGRSLRDPPLPRGAIGPITRLFRSGGLLGYREIGPAVALDVVKYMRRRQASGDGLAEAIAAFVLPQLEGLELEHAIAAYRLFRDALGGWTSASASDEFRARFVELFPGIKLPEG